MVEFKIKIIALFSSVYLYAIQTAANKLKWLNNIIGQPVCFYQLDNRSRAVVSPRTDISAVIREQLRFYIRMSVYHSFGCSLQLIGIDLIRKL